MGLATRLALMSKLNLQQRAALIFASPVSRTSPRLPDLLPKQSQQPQLWSKDSVLRRFTASSTSHQSSEGVSSAPQKDKDRNEVAVSEGKSGRKKKTKWLPQILGRRGGLWRKNKEPDHHLYSPGLGDALYQVSENLNRLFENLAPSRLLGRMKESDSGYKLRYEVPGLAKEDVKITIEDRVLTIRGEHEEEEEDGDASDDEYWSSTSYGYYNTSLLLPEDAKVEEIKAEMKDGVLSITIPRSESKGRDVKEIQIS